MNGIQLTTTTFPEGAQPLRCLIMDDEVLFAGPDCCRVLGIQYHQDAYRRLHPDNTIVLTCDDAVSGGQTPTIPKGFFGRNPKQGITFLTEAGLYQLIIRSDKPQAEPFQRWITGNLLPAIRRGDADLSFHQERMRETFEEVVGPAGLEVIAELKSTKGITLRQFADASIRCEHGEMVRRQSRSRRDENGEPYVWYRCPDVVGAAAGRTQTTCGTWSPAKIRRDGKPAEAGAIRDLKPTVVLEEGQLGFLFGPRDDVLAALRDLGFAA
ncbi:BRO family protein [Streptomyces cinnamoneus]|uniref:BRO-N domain-containing protein n=1 Tax=Streptomyces cinnamoneus TaxID=53446 RepID=UPI0033D5847F